MTRERDPGRDQHNSAMAQISARTDPEPYSDPDPGPVVRGVLLRDTRDGENTQYEVAELHSDGTLRVTGCDTGPRVTGFFGPGITSYDWTYLIPPGKIASLLIALGRQPGDDILTALAAYHHQHNGRIYNLLTSPEVGASFGNWHS